MKILLTAAIVSIFLLDAGGQSTREGKLVRCLYHDLASEKDYVKPEDIDASLCSHLMYIPFENYTSGDMFPIPRNATQNSAAADIIQGLVHLKSANPDLKLIIQPTYTHILWEYIRSSDESNLENATKWLQDNGFNGIDIPLVPFPEAMEAMADLICDIKTGFDKHGLEVTATLDEVDVDDFPRPAEGNEDIISKIERCCDYVVLYKSVYNETHTHRQTPVSLIKSHVDLYSQGGLPLNKILIALHTSGRIFTLKNPKVTDLGAKVTGPGQTTEGDYFIEYKELMVKFNDSSLEWTFRRDEETKEPYAFSTSGLWVSYEDKLSLEYKARYVMEKGLRGIEINSIESDDDGESGRRFPLTRAIHETFAGLPSTSATGRTRMPMQPSKV